MKEIFVNKKSILINNSLLDFEEIINLAYNRPFISEDKNIKIVYSYFGSSNKHVLDYGKSVEVEDCMKIIIET